MTRTIAWIIWIGGTVLWIGTALIIGVVNEDNWIQFLSAPQIYIALGLVVLNYQLFRKIHEIHDHLTRRHRMSVETYFSPDDDTQAKFLEFIGGAEKKLRVAVYGLHLPPLVDELIAAQKRGVDVQLVIDHTQARGKYERPEVVQLREAGIPIAEGTSQDHKIMHHKFVVRDDTTTLSGSWNFSLSASEENNYFDIIDDDARAAKFDAIWTEMYNWILEHEQQYQN